jgi:hypothetical protein
VRGVLRAGPGAAAAAAGVPGLAEGGAREAAGKKTKGTEGAEGTDKTRGAVIWPARRTWPVFLLAG